MHLRWDKRGQAALLREQTLAQSLLAASLWIAIKFEANRTTTPDAKIMSRITGAPRRGLAGAQAAAAAAVPHCGRPVTGRAASGNPLSPTTTKSCLIGPACAPCT